jgi:hypothetical protein
LSEPDNSVDYGRFGCRLRLFVVAWVAICLFASYAVAICVSGPRTTDIAQQVTISGLLLLPIGMLIYWLCDKFLQLPGRFAPAKIFLSALIILTLLSMIPSLIAP